MDDMSRQLNLKSYQQGLHAGKHNLPVSDADWEPEFLTEYKRGHTEGRAIRAAKFDSDQPDPSTV